MTTEQQTNAQTDAATPPRQEYPRPDFRRSGHWMSLNGQWDLFDGAVVQKITVPFAWETRASGVCRPWLEHATYSRQISEPQEWSADRIFLCFGAVHHKAVVRVNGQIVGEHEGGYSPFAIDITRQLRAESPSLLTVEVFAPADKRAIPHGKQRSIPRDDYDGVSFTPTSGIWQSVWLEERGKEYISQLRLRGDSLTGFDIELLLEGANPADQTVELEVLNTGEGLTLTTGADGKASGRIELQNPHQWSPEDPHLYEVAATVISDQGCADTVTATTGLRRIETRGEHLYLNDERLYIRGILDQGYWPESGLTAPTASALKSDIDLAHKLGYNLVRKHLKAEDPIWLHEADKAGILVWAEPACTSRYSEQSARAFDDQIGPMVERDGNHPAIIIWGLYNEEWGLDWDIPGNPSHAQAAERAYDILKELDPTRPIVENSGWAHVRTDLVDWHYYEPSLAEWKERVAGLAAGMLEGWPVRLAPDYTVEKTLYATDEFPRSGLPILNSEYGEGFTSLERAWHLRWETQELRRHDRFAGYVYTEFADVEHEAAGLLDFGRQPKDWGGCVPAWVNATTVIILDMIPRHAGADITPSDEVRCVDVRISHHGAATVRGQVHGCWLPAGASIEGDFRPSESTSEIVAEPFCSSEPTPLTIPSREEPGRYVLWFTGSDGCVLARTYLDAAEVEPLTRP